MILVTGATGHLGNVLVRKLVTQGLDVRAMVLPNDPGTAIEGLPIERVDGNVLEPETLDRAMENVDTVYHLAGIISIVPGAEKLMRRVNIEGVRNVANAALRSGVDRLVHVSSIHAFQRLPAGTVVDECTPLALDHPAGAYDETKARGTVALLDAVKAGLDAVIACPTGIVGPYDHLGSEMGATILNFAKRKLHLLVQGAYDFVDVRDVVEGLLLARDNGRVGEIYILSGHYVTIPQLKELVQRIAGVHSGHVILPEQIAMTFAQLMQHVYRMTRIIPRFTPYSLHTIFENARFTCAKAQEQLGYSPRPLVETIRDTLQWRQAVPQPNH
ncbi:MAG: NAD-dependent epimerase/dehydratase family protein [Anaerolineae bacterium]